MDPAERSLEPPRDFFLQPATYTASNPSLSKPEPQQLPLLQPRRFELLIPDPSREPSPEVRTPAFEYEHHVEFPPSPASSKPPQTPLPPIPGASTIDPVAKPKDPSVLNRRTPTPPSPAPSPKGTRVVIPATTTVSEGASFVISPFSLTSPISPWTGAEDPSPYQNHYQQSAAASTTSPRRLVPRSAAPGADDEWEEDFEEETARIRRDRLSQDYHQALVEQYRELVSPTSEIFGAVADMEEEQNHAVLRDPPSYPKPSKGGDKDNDGLALGLGKGEGSGHSGNSSGTRLPFVHETSPSPSPPPSDRRKNRKSSSSSAAATRMPQIRSLAAAAMRSPSHSPSPPPPPPSSSSSPSTLDKEQQRDGGGSGGGRSGASSWRLSTSVKQQHQHLSLYKKAVEAHRSHQRERRQQEMKKSIRVLGQTDPQQVVKEYVRVAAGAVAGPGIKPAYNSDNGNDRSTGGGSGNGGDAKEGGEGWL
ncbi:hypothetical protein SLS55_008225 [Diplodia seriata]|uniref:Uncharacterized protein n=1 Tax=Diplodia seriata TaxID=420778 RepID=A0ABR3C9W0_9PEZI